MTKMLQTIRSLTLQFEGSNIGVRLCTFKRYFRRGVWPLHTPLCLLYFSTSMLLVTFVSHVFYSVNTVCMKIHRCVCIPSSSLLFCIASALWKHSFSGEKVKHWNLTEVTKSSWSPRNSTSLFHHAILFKYFVVF